MEITEINMILLVTATLLLLILLIVCCGMLWYLIRQNRAMETLMATMQRKQPVPVTTPPETASPQTEKGQSLAQPGAMRPAPECHRTVDILQDRTNINRNMEAIGEKYGMDSITLASPDGLVIGSSDPDAVAIAAHYSHMIKLGIKPEDSRMQVFEMHYRGSPLIGIVRVDHPLDAPWLLSIEEDIRKILNLWLS
jgi:hypothetical protein